MCEQHLDALQTRLLHARRAHRPYRCPIKEQPLEGMTRHRLPRRHRALVAMICRERVAVNRPPPRGPKYYHIASIISDHYGWLLDQLRVEFGFSDTTVFEFNGRWTFSTTTLEALQTAYDVLPKPEQTVLRAPSGPSNDMYQHHPKESWHLPKYFADLHLGQCSLTQYLDECKAENKKRRGL